MTELYRTAAEMQNFFRQRNWKFCIIRKEDEVVRPLATLLFEAKKAPGILERLDQLIAHHKKPFTIIKRAKTRKKKS